VLTGSLLKMIHMKWIEGDEELVEDQEEVSLLL